MKNKSLFPLFCFIIFNILIIGCKKEKNDAPQDLNPAPMYKIGQDYGGGTIFYVDATGNHGLVVDTSNTIPKKSWAGSADSFVATNAISTEMGTGANNSQTIITSVGAGNYAAYACEELVLNGFNDWFLPSKAELYFLYAQKAEGLINNLNDDFYWSSSETSEDGAWSQSFITGSSSSAHKSGFYAVCAVRAF